MKTADIRPIEILLVEDSPSDADFTVEALKEAKVRNHLTSSRTACKPWSSCAARGNTPRRRGPI